MPLLRQIRTLDRWLMFRVHRWHAPKWVRAWMVVATWLGDGWLWWALAMILYWRKSQSLPALGLSALLSAALYSAVKRIVVRRRPFEIEPHVWSRAKAPDKYSFPSGHTMSAFAVAASVIPFHPQLAAPLLIAAGLLRERLDAAAPMLPDAALRPTLSAAPAPVVAARAAEL
ncbi:MAG: phosphatase PAP2 family protein, partial [Bryobacterales bacterium]|nr:phosphatase PAP2 family protein [Bryobacterales bacterium]